MPDYKLNERHMAEQRKPWTKFICTVGPQSWDAETMEQLIVAGADVLRTNFAHAKYEEFTARVELIKEINTKLGTNCLTQADLQGPNIRLGSDIPEEGIVIEAGSDHVFYTVGGTPQSADELLINDPTLHLDVKPGEPISFMDGDLEGEITWVDGQRIGVHMINGTNALKPRKSINLPASNLSTPAITEKDWRDLDFLVDTGVDIIALSFVGSRKEVDEVRDRIGLRPIKIMVKVERAAAIRNIEQIVDAADLVMIARGDLGIEVPLEEVPVLSRTIIDLCRFAGKPVITATQMLLSMVNNNRPTRAEVSDVANAVFNRSDAVMLSEETATGINPVNALETMVRIATRAEDYLYNRPNYFDTIFKK